MFVETIYKYKCSRNFFQLLLPYSTYSYICNYWASLINLLFKLKFPPVLQKLKKFTNFLHTHMMHMLIKVKHS